MSMELTGTQPQTRNDSTNQVTGNHAQAPASEPNQQHLTPDRPPQVHFAGGEGKQKRPRGFAAMDRTIVSEIARKRGQSGPLWPARLSRVHERRSARGRPQGRTCHSTPSVVRAMTNPAPPRSSPEGVSSHDDEGQNTENHDQESGSGQSG